MELEMETNNTGVEKVEASEQVSNEQIEMLEILSKIPDLTVKHQQKSETDLTNEEKFDTLRTLFIQSPLKFLTRFGDHLQKHPNHLECFKEMKDESIEAYLKLLRKNAADAKIRFKNRRYAALQKLVDTTDYFTEEEMQRRNPILFDQLIGKFQTKEEKEVFLKRSYDTAASSKTPLTDLLMAHMNRNEEGESFRRLDQEKQTADEEEADAEYFENDDEDEEMDDEPRSRERNGPRDDANEECEEIEDEEKELYKEEFFTTMYQHFLDGKDVDFDYSSVDNNEEYDVGENLELDEEEKYFDGEDPCEVHSESSGEDVLFKPPARCSEIESKIKDLTVEVSVGESLRVKSVPNHNDDEEDELDAYMKTIEKELQRNQ